MNYNAKMVVLQQIIEHSNKIYSSKGITVYVSLKLYIALTWPEMVKLFSKGIKLVVDEDRTETDFGFVKKCDEMINDPDNFFDNV